MSAFYTTNAVSEAECKRVLTSAADQGCTFWDTSDAYGPHTNERLIGGWLKETGRRKDIFLCTKFGFTKLADGSRGVRGDPAFVKAACDASLERLGVEQIDLYYQHRVDSKVPIEDTVGAMKELVEEGKIRYIGLSECSADTLRRAYKVHPGKYISNRYKYVDILMDLILYPMNAK
jgi:aryl-alcohol dehydrogenase-like predicted oxidoreductase